MVPILALGNAILFCLGLWFVVGLALVVLT
jgi:hypothetical protein